jgi:endonuclease/exonuclease/phosphatase family metal-dependent hydrolase
VIRFRVATYNTHKSRGMDWRVRPDRIVQVLRELDADIVALQEVLADQLPYLSEHSGMRHVFGAADHRHGNDYGNLLLTRFPVLGSENYDISVERREPRRCLRVDVQVSGGPVLHVFAVHLGTSWFERRKQALRMASADVIENPALRGCRILLGDFNEWTRGLSSRLMGERLSAGKRSRGYPGMIPFLHLDQIYHDPQLRLRAMRLHRTKASLVASDHLPLVAEFDAAPDRALDSP